MQLRRGSRNNVLAGLFLLASLALALVIFFSLSAAWDRLTVKRAKYTVWFDLADGADGLTKGAPVKIGGEKVGEVLKWSFGHDDKGTITSVDIEIEIKADLTIYENAIPFLHLPLLGSASTINFPTVGDPLTVVNPTNGDPRLQPGERIRGRIAPPSFLSQAGYGPEQTKQVQSIISNFDQTTDRLNRMTARVQDEIDPVLTQVKAVLADTKSISGDARDSLGPWRESVSDVLAKLQAASANIVDVVASAKQGMEETREMIASIRAGVEENKPKIARTFDNIEELTQKVKTDTYAGIMDLLENGRVGTEALAKAAEQVRVLVARRATDLDTTIANARLASDQLKLTMVEIRSAPWKLLAKPQGRKELENEVLYDSVRAYASAVSDLRAAAAALESYSAGDGKPSDVDRRTAEEILKDLRDSFDRYQKAERDFLRKLDNK